MSELRTQQVALARNTIVEACAALVTERRHLDFSLKEVADRAGVSLRTVYNHFPTREDLLDGLGQTFDERMRAGGSTEVDTLHDLDGILDAIAVNHARFEDLGGLSEAFAQMPFGDVGRDADRKARTTAVVGLLRSSMPSTPAGDARAIAVVIRHLLSHRSWFWLTREYGLTTEEVSAVVCWATRTLIETAESGDRPDLKEDP